MFSALHHDNFCFFNENEELNKYSFSSASKAIVPTKFFSLLNLRPDFTVSEDAED